jgi:hypothetical protein
MVWMPFNLLFCFMTKEQSTSIRNLWFRSHWLVHLSNSWFYKNVYGMGILALNLFKLKVCFCRQTRWGSWPFKGLEKFIIYKQTLNCVGNGLIVVITLVVNSWHFKTFQVLRECNQSSINAKNTLIIEINLNVYGVQLELEHRDLAV